MGTMRPNKYDVVIAGIQCTSNRVNLYSNGAKRFVRVTPGGKLKADESSAPPTVITISNYIPKEGIFPIDFKLTLYIEEIQSYICFTKNWRLMTSKILQENCYFYETMVNGYTRLNSAVNNTKFIGFTKNGLPVKYVNGIQPFESSFNFLTFKPRNDTENHTNHKIPHRNNNANNNNNNNALKTNMDQQQQQTSSPQQPPSPPHGHRHGRKGKRVKANRNAKKKHNNNNNLRNKINTSNNNNNNHNYNTYSSNNNNSNNNHNENDNNNNNNSNNKNKINDIENYNYNLNDNENSNSNNNNNLKRTRDAENQSIIKKPIRKKVTRDNNKTSPKHLRHSKNLRKKMRKIFTDDV